jgi:hypothetical protein
MPQIEEQEFDRCWMSWVIDRDHDDQRAPRPKAEGGGPKGRDGYRIADTK